MKRFSKITTTQLARICGVSQGTVDRALHDRPGIDPKTKEKILSASREYEYVPSPQGRDARRSLLIGVVLFDLYNTFFSKLAMSLVEQARREGYSVIFLFSDKDIKEEKSALDYFNYIGVDGIVLFSCGSDGEDYKNYLSSLRKPIVSVGNRLFDLPYIGIDDEAAMHELALHMLRVAGEGEIQYFAPILQRPLHENNAQRLRIAGFERAMAEHGRTYSFVYGEDALSADAAAILCSTDHYLLRAVQRLGATCGVPIAGFDNAAAPGGVYKSCFTVEYSTDEIAAECMNYFLRRKYRSEIAYRVLGVKT